MQAPWRNLLIVTGRRNWTFANAYAAHYVRLFRCQVSKKNRKICFASLACRSRYMAGAAIDACFSGAHSTARRHPEIHHTERKGSLIH